MANFEQICRLCVKENAELRYIFGDESHATLPEQLRIILQIQCEPTDGLPQKVCQACSNTMQQIQTTLDVYRSNDILLRKHLLGFEEIEEEGEDLPELGSLIEEYSLQDTYDAEILIQCNDETEQNEEWLEVDSDYEDDLITQDDADSDGTASVKHEKFTHKNDDISMLPTSSSNKKEPDTETILNTIRSKDFVCYICRCEPFESSKVLLDHLREHSDQLPYTCKICVMETIEIKQIRSLNNHLRMHEQPFKCNYCDRRYAEEQGREYHVQTYHVVDNESPFTCDVCGKLCASTLILRMHMKRHTIAYTCHICSRVFAQKSKLKRHVTTVHENTTSYECKICMKRLKTIDAYELHVRTIHEGQRDHECDICGRRFTNAAFVRAHRKQSQGGTCRPRNNWTSYYSTKINKDGTKTFCCSVCSKEFTRSIAEHLRTHFPVDFECSICFVKLPNKTSFDRHRLIHSELTFKCQECEKSFLSSRNLANHVASTHANGVSFESYLILEDEIEVDVEDYE